MKAKSGQKRRLVAGIILLIILLGISAFFLWQHLQPKADAPREDNTNATQGNSDPVPQTTDEYIGWSAYTGQRDGYELKYPAEWIVINESTNDGPYIRNMQFTGGGYPEGYINLRVLRDEGVVSGSDLTPQDWYAKLGVETVQKGPVTFTPDTVEPYTLNQFEAKKAKSIFTEINEDIFLLYEGDLYEINMYPYGISEDPTVKRILSSFKFL